MAAFHTNAAADTCRDFSRRLAGIVERFRIGAAGISLRFERGNIGFW